MNRSAVVLPFCVKFVTPLLIGGAEENSRGDGVGLTGKALRGCWRFWFRALLGGCLKHRSPEQIAELEKAVFGDLQRSTFRLAVQSSNGLPRLKSVNRLPPPTSTQSNRTTLAPFFDAVASGTSFNIKIAPRQSMSYDAQLILMATIWVWAHLGAVGNRSRRGFGSPVLADTGAFSSKFNEVAGRSSMTDVFLEDTSESFSNKHHLAVYLTSRLEAIRGLFCQWVDQDLLLPGSIEGSPIPLDEKYFVLSSLGQIAIGKTRFKSFPYAMAAIHGSSMCDELGRAGVGGRFASPAFIRLHQIHDIRGMVTLIPVMTWCQQKNISRYPAGRSLVKFFRSAGFRDTL